MPQGESRDLWLPGGLGAALIVGLLVLGVFGPGVTNLLFMFAAFGVFVLLLAWLAAMPTFLFIGIRNLHVPRSSRVPVWKVLGRCRLARSWSPWDALSWIAMLFPGTGGFLISLLVVSATSGLTAVDVGTDWNSPQLDSMIIIADPSVDTLSERIAPDRPFHRALLAMVFCGVCAVWVSRRGFLGGIPETPFIRISQHSLRSGRAPPSAGLVG